MATDNLKVLGQSKPSAGVLTNLYVVPVATQSVLSTLRIVNLGSGDALIRVTVAPAGAADTDAHTLWPLSALGGLGSIGITEGWSLAATDVVRVYSNNGMVAFTAFGSERT